MASQFCLGLKGMKWGKQVDEEEIMVTVSVRQERANSPVMQTLNQMNLGRLVFGQGALPIVQGNEVLGAVGVSGATAQQDEDTAKAALTALQGTA